MMGWQRLRPQVHYAILQRSDREFEMPQFDMVRARYALNFIEAMKLHGFPSEPILEPMRLSEEFLQRPNQLIPAYQLWELVRQISLQTGLNDLGLEAGQFASVEAHGEFGKIVFAIPTLLQRVSSFCEQAQAEYSRADFWLEASGKNTQFYRGPIAGDVHQLRGTELYVLAMMIETVGSSNGKDVVFNSIELQTHYGEELDKYLRTISTRRLYGQANTCLKISKHTLARSIDIMIQFQDSSAPSAGVQLNHIDEFSSLRTLIDQHSDRHQFSIEDAARMFGVNVRKFQRHLSENGTSFREIKNDVVCARASKLLRDTNISIADIAASLGYTSPNNFSRAYRKWYGITPITYRKIAQQSTVTP
jgi:AraC-like DNA-binding protein